MSQITLDEPLGTPSFTQRLEFLHKVLPPGHLTREAHHQLRLLHWLFDHVVDLHRCPFYVMNSQWGIIINDVMSTPPVNNTWHTVSRRTFCIKWIFIYG